MTIDSTADMMSSEADGRPVCSTVETPRQCCREQRHAALGETSSPTVPYGRALLFCLLTDRVYQIDKRKEVSVQGALVRTRFASSAAHID